MISKRLFSVWGDSNGPNTMVEGNKRPVFADGTTMPECHNCYGVGGYDLYSEARTWFNTLIDMYHKKRLPEFQKIAERETDAL